MAKKANIWNWTRYTCSEAAASTPIGRTTIRGTGTVGHQRQQASARP